MRLVVKYACSKETYWHCLQMDMSQLFSRPVVLVDIAENITNMLHLLSRYKLLFNMSNSSTIIQNSEIKHTNIEKR